MKWALVIGTVAVLALGLGGTAYAFHSGGVAECEGCHSMHNPAAGGSNLLVGATKSATCLSCHENSSDTGPSSYHVSTAGTTITGLPLQRTPGGDFGWLKKTFTYTYSGTTTNETGGGHNIVAPDLGYAAAGGTAPGGTFPASNLHCNSCHDPHGKFRRVDTGEIVTTGKPIKGSGSYNGASNEPTATAAVGVYRLLGGSGYQAGGTTIGFTGVPAAKAPSTFNQTEATNQVRVAYGVKTTQGHVSWSNWCATCHTDMHSTGSYVHPTDQALGATVIANYNAYVKSGDMTGTSASAYLTLTPFATNSGDYTVLAPLASNTTATSAGPSSGDQVICLSCHRAHASGFSHSLRFDQGYEFMTKGGQYIGSDNPEVTGSRAPLQHRGRDNAAWTAAYYERPATQFATYQRVLCNKCHAKD